MTWAQELKSYMACYRDTPCSVEHCDAIRMPFGVYKGTRVKDLDPRWREQFCHSWLAKEAKHDEWYEDNLVLAFALQFLVNEHQATEIGERMMRRGAYTTASGSVGA